MKMTFEKTNFHPKVSLSSTHLLHKLTFTRDWSRLRAGASLERDFETSFVLRRWKVDQIKSSVDAGRKGGREVSAAVSRRKYAAGLWRLHLPEFPSNGDRSLGLQIYNPKLSNPPMADKMKPPSTLSVYLYIPNIIGYVRILMNCFAFAICFKNKALFSILYFVSFVCDALDGWFARKLNQVSTFGAVLDMVTDRISTACLLVILSQVYRPGLIFLSLLALDIASHWMQMYSTFLMGKTSHKDVRDSSNWLFKLYYGNRKFMCYCCVSCEVLYILLFLLARKETVNLSDVLVNAATQSWLYLLSLALIIIGWLIKQIVNVIQIKAAADACIIYDISKKQ